MCDVVSDVVCYVVSNGLYDVVCGVVMMMRMVVWLLVRWND